MVISFPCLFCQQVQSFRFQILSFLQSRIWSHLQRRLDGFDEVTLKDEKEEHALTHKTTDWSMHSEIMEHHSLSTGAQVIIFKVSTKKRNSPAAHHRRLMVCGGREGLLFFLLLDNDLSSWTRDELSVSNRKPQKALKEKRPDVLDYPDNVLNNFLFCNG
jgi:hypothetical protein